MLIVQEGFKNAWYLGLISDTMQDRSNLPVCHCMINNIVYSKSQKGKKVFVSELSLCQI